MTRTVLAVDPRLRGTTLAARVLMAGDSVAGRRAATVSTVVE
jgi:hypothetical protein